MSEVRSTEAVYQRDSEFWAQYVKGRPRIPQSYFDTIFNYHAKHSGTFSVAHDVGAGPGIYAPRLVDRFSHVILSDPFESNINTAREQLSAQGDDRCSFVISTLENTIHTQPASSVDLIFCQSMWHFTKPDEAIEAVAHQLKPGGTFAVSMAGFPVFKDPKVWEVCTRMFRAIAVDGISKRGGPYGPARGTVRAQLSRLDSVPLKGEYFQPGGLRIKMRDPLGPGRDFSREALVPDEWKDDLPPLVEVGPDDVVQETEETAEWTFKVNIQGLRDIMMTFPHEDESGAQAKLWKEMEDLLGDGETEGVWPYSLVLGTRR